MSFNAYYYSFQPTGNEDIDSILKAVAAAGKSFHNTEDWNEEHDWHNNGVSVADSIQYAADIAAKNLHKREISG